MTLRFDHGGPPPPDPNEERRGAAPVGYLSELPALECAAILYMRAWCEGGSPRTHIARDFHLMLGERAATSALADFEALLHLAIGRARRPLMRHGVHCRCFGGDESAFANMIAAAAARDREDAMLFASTLLPGPAAFEVVLLAERLGQVFLRIARAPEQPVSATHRLGHALKH